MSLAIGVFFGALQVSVTAFATRHGVGGSAGLLYGLLSVTSLLAGFAYGARNWRGAPANQLVVTLLLITVGSLPLLFAGGPGSLAIALILPGFGLAPSMIVSALLTERIVDKAGLTRAFALLSSASAVGSALASAVAGRAVDGHGTWGFGIAVIAVGVATVVGWAGRRVFDVCEGRDAARNRSVESLAGGRG
ncbi:MAG TPA: hypothetical protein VHX38_27820 [Pseudonocardiaceae bacterium]|nr:hypothetical protein [Pseudonocardiaceae bacterium]